jgi:hypothetical protein
VYFGGFMLVAELLKEQGNGANIPLCLSLKTNDLYESMGDEQDFGQQQSESETILPIDGLFKPKEVPRYFGGSCFQMTSLM